MGKYFGTDGFRGEANVVLTFDHAIKIGRFLGWYYGARIGKKAKILIGKDTRRSSYMFEYALCTGLMASGADAYIMHVTTTPSVSYITRTDSFDCGIMISASHNPYYDNGIKLMNHNGEKMDEETIAEVEKYLDGEIAEIPMAKDSEIGQLRAEKYADAVDLVDWTVPGIRHRILSGELKAAATDLAVIGEERNMEARKDLIGKLIVPRRLG